MKLRVFAILFLIVGLGSALAADNKATVKKGAVELSFCEIRGFSGTALCGEYEVFENRETMTGRKIAMRVVVIPAQSENPLPDPVFFFMGGPGQGAADVAGFVASGNAALSSMRDLVFIDQRGTGSSNGLKCDTTGPPDQLGTYLQDMFEPAYVNACLEKLRANADLTLYTTEIAMDDIDEIRAALGYQQINVTGGSYGTRAVMTYMRRHPETVRTAFIRGIAPAGEYIPAGFARDAQAALDDLIADCKADSACNKAFPNFGENVTKILEQVKKEPVSVSLMNPMSQSQETVKLGFGPLVTIIRAMLYGTQRSAQLPAVVELAANGEWAPITFAAAMYSRGIGQGIADGLYLSVTCAEDLPYFDHKLWRKRSQTSFLGSYRIDQQAGACDRWPRGKVSDAFFKPLRSAIPTLIMSGEVDPVTPPAMGEKVAKYLSNSLHVVIPNAAHGMGGANLCMQSLYGQFLADAKVEGLDPGCALEVKRPPFQTTEQVLQQLPGGSGR